MFTLVFKRMTSMYVQVTHKEKGVGYPESGALVDGYEAPKWVLGQELRYNTVYPINQKSFTD